MKSLVLSLFSLLTFTSVAQADLGCKMICIEMQPMELTHNGVYKEYLTVNRRKDEVGFFESLTGVTDAELGEIAQDHCIQTLREMCNKTTRGCDESVSSQNVRAFGRLDTVRAGNEKLPLASSRKLSVKEDCGYMEAPARDDDEN